METRASIREELGIVQIEDPKVANKPLSSEDAKKYREFMQSTLEMMRESFEDEKPTRWNMTIQLEGSWMNLKTVGDMLKKICADNDVTYRVDKKRSRKID